MKTAPRTTALTRARRAVGLWIAGVRPSAARPVGRRALSGRRGYVGADAGYRTQGWNTPSTSADAEIEAGLITLRDRARDLVRNSAHGKRAITSLTYNLIGTGLRPDVDTGREDLDRKIVDLWNAWGAKAYTSSDMGIYGFQALAARSWFESGEVLIRRRPRRLEDMAGLPPLQLQALEGDFLPVDLSDDSSRIAQGVEFDSIGRRIAYHVYKAHPGAPFAWGNFAGRWETQRISARDMLHLYLEARPGQVRGVTALAPIISALWDLAGYADAERVRAKSAACLVAIVTGGDPDSVAVGTADSIADQTDSEGSVLTDSEGNPVEQLRPAMVAQCPPGKDVKFTTPGTATGHAEGLSAGLHEIAAGVDLAYEVLTGDLSQVNFASIRLGLNEQYRVIRALREHVFIPLFLNKVWTWFAEYAVAAGLLPDVPGLWSPTWSQPQLASVDREADIKAASSAVRNGFSSRRAEIAAMGRDPDDVDAEISKDMAARDAAGIVTDSDPRQTAVGGQIQATWTPAKSTSTAS